MQHIANILTQKGESVHTTSVSIQSAFWVMPLATLIASFSGLSEHIFKVIPERKFYWY